MQGLKPPLNLVQSLDPDSIFRLDADNQTDSQLEAEDLAYEKALLRSLFEYVRVGEIDRAIDMCRQSDQSWRAASLRGGTLYSDPILNTLKCSQDEDDFDQAETYPAVICGNINRSLWKFMCRKIASNVSGAKPTQY